MGSLSLRRRENNSDGLHCRWYVLGLSRNVLEREIAVMPSYKIEKQ